MPTIAVDKAALLKALEREYTTEEFDELCFEFGLELDEDTSQSTKPEDLAQPAQLKIEIPANRYDMLCFEGIAMNLRVFLQKEKLPKWSLTAPASGEVETLTIKEEVSKYSMETYYILALFSNHCRQRKFGHSALESSFETSSLPKSDTTLS